MFVVTFVILWKSTHRSSTFGKCVKSLCSILLVLCYVRGSVLCCGMCYVRGSVLCCGMCFVVFFFVYIVLCNMLFVFMLCCDLDLCLCYVFFLC
jgi:hypothetical protein